MRPSNRSSVLRVFSCPVHGVPPHGLQACDQCEQSLEERRYHTIVADPPWHYGHRPGNFERATVNGVRQAATHAAPDVSLPYATLSVEEISALPVSELAERDAHLYLWTTQRYLRDAYDVVDAWGFAPSAVLVWCKPPKGIVGTFICSTEYILFARRGSLAAKRKHLGTWFTWNRGEHSAKPEAFLDLVEEISPGPYLELFARRNRFGWDTWGNEALAHVELRP